MPSCCTAAENSATTASIFWLHSATVVHSCATPKTATYSSAGTFTRPLAARNIPSEGWASPGRGMRLLRSACFARELPLDCEYPMLPLVWAEAKIPQTRPATATVNALIVVITLFKSAYSFDGLLGLGSGGTS